MNITNTTFCIVKKREFRDAAPEGVLSNLNPLRAGAALMHTWVFLGAIRGPPCEEMQQYGP